MSTESKLVLSAIVLAIVIPIASWVLRRLIRGEPMEDSGENSLMPPSGPDVSGGTGL